MSNEIIKVLDDLAQRFGVMIDWSQENVLPYITNIFDRLITYRICVIIVWLIFSLMFVLYGVFGRKISEKKICKNYEQYVERRKANNFSFDSYEDYNYLNFEEHIMATAVARIVFGILGMILLVSGIFNLIEILILPELYIIDFITNLM